MHNESNLLRIIHNIIKASENQPNKFRRQIYLLPPKTFEKYILLTVNFYTTDICGYYRIWLILSINWMIFVYPWTFNRKKNNKLKHFQTSRSISNTELFMHFRMSRQNSWKYLKGMKNTKIPRRFFRSMTASR